MAAEVIAFDSSKQSSYAKAVKKIKKSIASEAARKDSEPKFGRGIILISHLPHGFYENELRGYFSQFGKITRLRVARSKKTGRPKGYAFVEFEFEEVAQIAAESMHNYLMFERLVKCKVLTGNVNAKKLFGGPEYGTSNYPALVKRNQTKEKQLEPMTEEEKAKTLQIRLSSIQKRNKKLAELGIDYEFKMKSKTSPATIPIIPVASASEEIKIEPEKAKKTADKGKSPAKLNFSPKLLRSRVKTGEIQTSIPNSTPDKKAQPMKKTRMSLDVPREMKKSPEKSTTTPTSKLSKKQERMSCNVPLMTMKSPAPAKKKLAAMGTPGKGDMSKSPASEAAKTAKNKRMSCTVPAAVSKPEKTLPKFSPKLLRSRAKETGVAPVATPLPKRRKSTF